MPESPESAPPTCDSCGCLETEDNEFVVCTENGQTYHYCEGCYQP